MFIPLSDTDSNANPYYTPRITLLLLTINAAVFLYEIAALALNPLSLLVFVMHWGITPVLLTQSPDAHAFLTILTSMFVHAGWFHFLGNMLFLWVFGYGVEKHMGSASFSLLYLISGIVAVLSHVALNPESPFPLIGASGAVSGILGAFIVKFPRSRIRMLMIVIPIKLPALVYIGFWFIFNVLDGYRLEVMGDEALRGVAYMAHIGGFLIGALVMAILRVVENE